MPKLKRVLAAATVHEYVMGLHKYIKFNYEKPATPYH